MSDPTSMHKLKKNVTDLYEMHTAILQTIFRKQE